MSKLKLNESAFSLNHSEAMELNTTQPPWLPTICFISLYQSTGMINVNPNAARYGGVRRGVDASADIYLSIYPLLLTQFTIKSHLIGQVFPSEMSGLWSRIKPSIPGRKRWLVENRVIGRKQVLVDSPWFISVAATTGRLIC